MAQSKQQTQKRTSSGSSASSSDSGSNSTRRSRTQSAQKRGQHSSRQARTQGSRPATTRSSRSRSSATRSSKGNSNAGSPKRRSSQTQYRKRKGAAAASNAITPRRLLIAGTLLIVLIALITWGVSSCVTTKQHKKQWRHDHYWQSTVEAAEDFYGVDRAYTTAILTMIQVESDGNVDIDKHHDILQALEGDGKKILLKGVKKQGIKGNTPEASIYAGTYEFSLCIADFKKYLGRDPVPDDLSDVALLAQGYNYGHIGWFKYLKRNGIELWTLETSEAYQQKINGLGTATHGQKIMNTYPRIAEE